MNIRISGKTLKSLRMRYRASIRAASNITGVDASTLEDWEENGTELSISKAKALAKKYHTHWSVFLLEDTVAPIREPINHRAGYADSARFSMDTFHAYELARDLITSSAEIDGQVVNPSLKNLCSSRHSPIKASECSAKVREMLNIDIETIRNIKNGPAGTYNFWKEKVSSLGIYISEQDMPEDETKAFLLEDEGRAVIVVNRKDKYPHSKVFSLLHELGHIIKGDSSAACLTSIAATRLSPDESWCNQFASELILPDSELLRDDLVDSLLSSQEPAIAIRMLSTKYRASFTVVMYKLLRHKKISDKQHAQMQVFFEKVILPKFKSKPKADKEIKLGKMYYVRKDISKASKSLSVEVIEKHMSGSISYSQAAKLLGTKTRYIEDIKAAVGFGS